MEAVPSTISTTMNIRNYICRCHRTRAPMLSSVKVTKPLARQHTRNPQYFCSNKKLCYKGESIPQVHNDNSKVQNVARVVRRRYTRWYKFTLTDYPAVKETQLLLAYGNKHSQKLKTWKKIPLNAAFQIHDIRHCILIGKLLGSKITIHSHLDFNNYYNIQSK